MGMMGMAGSTRVSMVNGNQGIGSRNVRQMYNCLKWNALLAFALRIHAPYSGISRRYKQTVRSWMQAEKAMRAASGKNLGSELIGRAQQVQ